MPTDRSLLVYTFAAFACGSPPTSDAPALPVEFTGCEAVLRGPICTVAAEPAPLVLWIDAPPGATYTVTVGGAELDADSYAVAGGTRLRLTPPATGGLLQLADRETGSAFSLHLRSSVRDPALAPAWKLLKTGDLAGARAAAVPSDTPLARAEAAALHRKLAFLAVQAAADGPAREAAIAESLRAADAAARAADAADLVSELGDAALAAAWLTIHDRRDILSARTWLERQQAAHADDPKARATASYYAGLVAYAAGDLREALRAFADGEQRTRRLGLVADELAAAAMHTVALAELGRGDEVLARARRAEAALPALQPCDRAALLTNVGWSLLLLAEAGQPADDPTPALEHALALSEPGGGCPEPAKADNLRLNLALAALQRDEPDEARPFLDAVREHAPTGRTALWLREFDGRADLLSGHVPDDSELLARDPNDAAGVELGLRWSATVRRAQALARARLYDAALATFAEAEALLDAMLRAVALDKGRELFLAGKQRGSRLLVELLVDLGRPGEALCAARLARLRTLRSLDRAARLESLDPAARARWDAAIADYQSSRERESKLQARAWQFVGAAGERHREQQRLEHDAAARALDAAYTALGDASAPPRCTDLRPPAPGELLLLILPGTDESLVFATDTAGVAVTRHPAGPLDGDQLLKPFADRLAGVERLRVLPVSSDIPAHALPYAGDVVLSHWPVAYSLDLPARPARPPGRGALVVADPSGNLAYARDETRAVATALSRQSFTVTHIEQSDATADAVRTALPAAALLHYAGHGRREGVSGWGSVLALADDVSFGIGDVLALPSAPSTVVLSGCETGASDPYALAGGMNLARAFLLAGTDAVIAASDVIDDAVAAEVSANLYHDLDPTARFDAPARLRQALLKLRSGRDTAGEWAKFRAFVP